MKKILKSLYDACEYYEENLGKKSISQIAREFNVERHGITNHAKDYKNYCYFKDNYCYYISEKEKEPVLYFLNNESVTVADITRKFNTKSDTLKRRMEVMGYSYERRYDRKFNRNAFDEINTEEDAYWLGFILADGYLNEDRGFLKIKLGIKDEKHLNKFVDYMQEENKDIVKYETGGAYTKDNLCVSVEFNSSTIVNNLKKWGIFQGKSGKEDPIEFKDKNLKKAYIRGMIDGDGHIENGYIKYVGSYESCLYIKNYISKFYNYKKECKYIYPKGAIYSFDLRNKTVNEFLKDTYNNSKIYLDRKYKVVQDIK